MADEIKPEILAPAGDADCFLAALAAGANGIYLGLKNFSARMQARNFGLGELARLVELAHQNNCRVYVAMNNLLRQAELEPAYRLARRLATLVEPDGLIIQDLAMLDLARQAQFTGSIALSTLANVSDPAGLAQARILGADRVIAPRELSIDELRQMGQACPAGLELECFVHGALCYCVSGRCYWSSYMGGKSGLRGRCVQPCRRLYGRKRRGKGSQKPGERHFSCQDLELLPVVRKLLSIPNLVSWKIEGRKKGPHYVYHAVTAYRILRDEGEDAQKRKMAQEILQMALGRPGVRARFLPQKKYQPMAPAGQTSSGLLAGKTNIRQDGKCVIRPHLELLPRDYLRIGVEDEKWHSTLPVSRRTPRGADLLLNLPKHKTPPSGTSVYLIDRREPGLARLLAQWQARLDRIPEAPVRPVESRPVLPAGAKTDFRVNMRVAASLIRPAPREFACVWLTARTAEISRTYYARVYFWLAPAIWPDESSATQRLISRLWQGGARQFVCNAPWQRGFFPEKLPGDAKLVAGPFCNIANSLAVAELQKLGFIAAYVSPELTERDFLALPKSSPLPLGVVLSGNWPVGISRFGLLGLDAGEVFSSPRGENFWSLNRAGLTWIFPGWQLDLSSRRRELEQAGYSFFGVMEEKGTPAEKSRPGLFNWDGALL
ncbi:MAG: U32 family peptidase [Desulfovibrio sp.]|nr:U32 family peptidase [Desulfovibrio sp.]